MQYKVVKVVKFTKKNQKNAKKRLCINIYKVIRATGIFSDA